MGMLKWGLAFQPSIVNRPKEEDKSRNILRAGTHHPPSTLARFPLLSDSCKHHHKAGKFHFIQLYKIRHFFTAFPSFPCTGPCSQKAAGQAALDESPQVIPAARMKCSPPSSTFVAALVTPCTPPLQLWWPLINHNLVKSINNSAPIPGVQLKSLL